jgi:hypothetical protein
MSRIMSSCQEKIYWCMIVKVKTYLGKINKNKGYNLKNFTKFQLISDNLISN